MSDHKRVEQQHVEAALKALLPVPAALDRDRLMFRAGRAAHRSPAWRAGLLAGLLALLAGAGGTFLVMRDSGLRVEYVSVYVSPATAPKPPPPAESPKAPSTPAPESSPVPVVALPEPTWDWFASMTSPAGGYLQLRDQALRWGVEALPSAPAGVAEGTAPLPKNLLQMQAKMLNKMPGF